MIKNNANRKAGPDGRRQILKLLNVVPTVIVCLYQVSMITNLIMHLVP